MRLLIDRLRSIDARRMALLDRVAALDDAVLHRKPSPNAWSIIEIIEHLVVAERHVLGDVHQLAAAPALERSLKNRIRYRIVMFVLRAGIPVRAPSRAMLPKGGQTFAELRRQWDEQYLLLERYIASLDAQSATRAIFRHPVAGALPVAEAIAMLDAHLARHDAQIARLQG